MATCDPQILVTDGACFACLDSKELAIAKLVLLCRIAQAINPMATCDPATLMEDGKCLACLDARQLQIAETQLLCDIAATITGGGGGAGLGFVVVTLVDPVAPPASGAGLVYNRTNGSLWAWDPVLLIWVQLLA
jgi:hypothetical protein